MVVIQKLQLYVTIAAVTFGIINKRKDGWANQLINGKKNKKQKQIIFSPNLNVQV